MMIAVIKMPAVMSRHVPTIVRLRMPSFEVCPSVASGRAPAVTTGWA
jgi:hypothetical protein